MPCADITHDDCLRHEMGAGHPDSSMRFCFLDDVAVGIHHATDEGGCNLDGLARSVVSHVGELVGADRAAGLDIAPDIPQSKDLR